MLTHRTRPREARVGFSSVLRPLCVSALNQAFLRPIIVITTLLVAASLVGCDRSRGPTVRVGSKLDTESVTLAAIAGDLARAQGANVLRRDRLGGTQVVWKSLLAGEVDVYPEYTGTIANEILAGSGATSDAAMRAALAERGVEMTAPLGFNNTYAIGMREDVAERLGIRSLSDLRRHPELRFGFSNEFVSRSDGWPGLRERYQLPQQNAGGMEHTLAYKAVDAGSIDATDLYSTDAEIRLFHLRVLQDDLHYFPEYNALLLYRADLRQRAPKVVAALRRLEGKVGEADMRAMNARSKIDQTSNDQIAADFLRDRMGVAASVHTDSVARRILQRTLEHLYLVGVSLLGALLVGLPLGIIAAKVRWVGRAILALVAVLFTIPSLALLVFLIPLLGIGPKPAILALFLYSLLPIVRNTHAGLTGISPPLRESGEALGLPAMVRLRRIELPLAAGAILAGIKTAAVIDVGMATLGGLINAGGYGQPIVTGLTLYNIPLILQGAVPAAIMALVVEGLFELAERRLIPLGLRQRRASV